MANIGYCSINSHSGHIKKRKLQTLKNPVGTMASEAGKKPDEALKIGTALQAKA